MKFENTEVYGFKRALKGMRNPLESWRKNDTVEENGKVVIGENDLDLAQRLIKSGSEHRKFMRQIFVSVDITGPDMTTENNVLNAFAQVKGYKKAGKDKVFLCNSSNRPVVVLQKKEADVKLSVLNGEWKIKEVNGEAIPSGMEKQPFIAFDVKKKTIHGNAGCNLINGGFETSTSNAKSISFPGVASTMMACPDMETEGKVLKAINEVKSFDVLSGGGIGLYDANGALVIVLEK